MIAEQNGISRLRRLALVMMALTTAVIVSACAAPAAAPPAPAAAPVATQVATAVPAAPAASAATEAPPPTKVAPAAPVATVVATEAPATAPAPTEADAAGAALAAAPTQAPAPASAASSVSFASDVMPIFEKTCARCHGGSNGTEGDLSLRTYENVMKGGESGAVVVAGDPDNSLLVELIREGEMPRRAPDLPQEQIDLIAQWVAEGALNN